MDAERRFDLKDVQRVAQVLAGTDELVPMKVLTLLADLRQRAVAETCERCRKHDELRQDDEGYEYHWTPGIGATVCDARKLRTLPLVTP